MVTEHHNAGGIATLNSHCKPLTQERCWPWFVANFWKAASNHRYKFHGMLTPNAGWLGGNWNELVARTNALVSFFSSAPVAAEPVFLLFGRAHDCAYVLGQVASQARQRPLFHEIWVAPSGLLSLRPQSECGSRVAYAPAELNARHRLSLIWLWREWLPEP